MEVGYKAVEGSDEDILHWGESTWQVLESCF